MCTRGESGGGVNGRLNEVKVLQSDQDSTGTVMRNYLLNPVSFLFFFFFFFSFIKCKYVFSRGKLATLIAVLGVKTNQRVPLSLAVDVSPPSGRARAAD